MLKGFLTSGFFSLIIFPHFPDYPIKTIFTVNKTGGEWTTPGVNDAGG
jgi:hypothetical protein